MSDAFQPPESSQNPEPEDEDLVDEIRDRTAWKPKLLVRTAGVAVLLAVALGLAVGPLWWNPPTYPTEDVEFQFPERIPTSGDAPMLMTGPAGAEITVYQDHNHREWAPNSHLTYADNWSSVDLEEIARTRLSAPGDARWATGMLTLRRSQLQFDEGNRVPVLLRIELPGRAFGDLDGPRRVLWQTVALNLEEDDSELESLRRRVPPLTIEEDARPLVWGARSADRGNARFVWTTLPHPSAPKPRRIALLTQLSFAETVVEDPGERTRPTLQLRAETPSLRAGPDQAWTNELRLKVDATGMVVFEHRGFDGAASKAPQLEVAIADERPGEAAEKPTDASSGDNDSENDGADDRDNREDRRDWQPRGTMRLQLPPVHVSPNHLPAGGGEVTVELLRSKHAIPEGEPWHDVIPRSAPAGDAPTIAPARQLTVVLLQHDRLVARHHYNSVPPDGRLSFSIPEEVRGEAILMTLDDRGYLSRHPVWVGPGEAGFLGADWYGLSDQPEALLPVVADLWAHRPHYDPPDPFLDYAFDSPYQVHTALQSPTSLAGLGLLGALVIALLILSARQTWITANPSRFAAPSGPVASIFLLLFVLFGGLYFARPFAFLLVWVAVFIFTTLRIWGGASDDLSIDVARWAWTGVGAAVCAGIGTALVRFWTETATQFYLAGMAVAGFLLCWQAGVWLERLRHEQPDRVTRSLVTLVPLLFGTAVVAGGIAV